MTPERRQKIFASLGIEGTDNNDIWSQGTSWEGEPFNELLGAVPDGYEVVDGRYRAIKDNTQPESRNSYNGITPERRNEIFREFGIETGDKNSPDDAAHSPDMGTIPYSTAKSDYGRMSSFLPTSNEVYSDEVKADANTKAGMSDAGDKPLIPQQPTSKTRDTNPEQTVKNTGEHATQGIPLADAGSQYGQLSSVLPAPAGVDTAKLAQKSPLDTFMEQKLPDMVDTAIAEGGKRYAQNKSRKKSFWERVSALGEQVEFGAVKELADIRSEAGPEQVMANVVKGIAEEKALTDMISQIASGDEEYAKAKRSFDSTVGVGDNELTDEEVQKIMDSLTPEQKAEAEKEIELRKKKIEEEFQKVNTAYGNAYSRAASSVEERIKGEIINILARRNMPASEAEAFGRILRNNSFFGMAQELAIEKLAGGHGLSRQIEQTSIEMYDPATLTRILGGVAALAADTPVFGAGGMLGEAGARAVTKAATKMVARDIMKRAPQLAKGTATEIAGRLAASNRLTQALASSVASAGTLGTYDTLASVTEQAIGGDVDIAEVLKAAGRGTATGAIVGPIGSLTGNLTRRYGLDNAGDIAAKVSIGTGGLLAENAAFVGMGSLFDSSENGAGTAEAFAEGLATLGIMKGLSAIRNGINRRNSYAEKLLRDTEFTKGEMDALNAEGIDARSYKRAVYDLLTSRNERLLGEQRDKVLADYDRIMASENIPATAKIKLQYLVKGTIPAGTPRPVDVTVDAREDGRFEVVQRDPAGNIITKDIYDNRRDADYAVREGQHLRDMNAVLYYGNKLDEMRYRESLFEAAKRLSEYENGRYEDYIGVVLKASKKETLTQSESRTLRNIVETARPILNESTNATTMILRNIADRHGLTQKELERAIARPVSARPEKERLAVEDLASSLRRVVTQTEETNRQAREQYDADARREQLKTPEQKQAEAERDEIVRQAEEAVDAQIERATNVSDGNIYTVRLDDANGSQVTVRNGHIAFNNQTGEVDTALSDPTVVVEYADGHSKMVSVRDIAYVEDMLPAEQAKNEVHENIRAGVAEAERQGRIAEAVTNGQAVTLADGREGTIVAQNQDGSFTFRDANGEESAITAEEITDAAYDNKPVSGGSIDIDPEPAGKQNGTAPLQNGLSEDRDSENLSVRQTDIQAGQTDKASALSRIPVGQDGSPMYERVDAGTAWDAIVEQLNGDETIAARIADSMLRDKQEALKRLEKSNPRKGTTVAEKIAAERERMDAIERANADVKAWQRIVAVPQERQQTVEAERMEQVSNVKLSNVTDENGLPFVFAPSGALEFGKIDEETGLKPAPILLSKGVVTNPKTKSGYGLAHIEARHGDQIRNAGFKSVVDFIEEVAKNYERIKEGNIRNGRPTYILQIKDRHNNTLMVELSSDGNYWNVNTAGIFKESYGKNKKEVYSRHTTAKQSVETVEASQEVKQSDTTTSSRMNAPTTSSENKDTDITVNSKNTDEKISQAEAEVETNPTDGQKEAGNYRKGHVRIDGLDITIEQPKGSVRRGTDKSGKAWETTMRNTYGYIRGTQGVDDDHIDVFLSDSPTEGNVYIVDQKNADVNFDEHKVMYGFGSEEEARKAYLSNYEKGWRGLGAITEVSKDEFRKWIDSSHRKTKPFAEYKNVKKSIWADVKPVGVGAFGNIYDQFKGKVRDAIEFLRSHESGDLLGVSHRDGFGDVDYVWGDKSGGLAHIIDKHVGNGKSFPNIDDAAKEIDSIIQNGELAFENGDKAVFRTGNKLVTVRKNLREKGKKIADKNWVLTAYDETSADNASAISDANQAQAARGTAVSDSKDSKKTTGTQPATENIPPHLMPKMLKDAYESGNAEDISRAETAMREFIMNTDDMRKVAETYRLSIERVRSEEKGSPTHRMNDFVATATKELLKKNGMGVLTGIARKRLEAAKESTDTALLDILAGDREFNVREAVIRNPNTGDDTLRRIAAESAYGTLRQEAENALAARSMGPVDAQGNPVDEHGNLRLEKIFSIDELTDKDFTAPTRNVELPHLPQNVADAIGTNGRPVIIKKNIFEKNHTAHSELTPEQGREILGRALYNTTFVGQAQPIRRPDYWVAVQTSDKNAITVLEVNSNKDNVEIVGWRRIDSKGLSKLRRQAEREGGQFLILTSEDAAAALSALPSDMPSASKGSKRSANSQPLAEKIEDVGEKIGGARKDIARELAERQRQVNDNPSDILNDIRRMPVSRIFNFDYAALRKEGVSNEVITLLQVIRDAIPSKPRTDYKLRRWADDTFRAYRACLELVTAEEQIRQRVIDGLMQDGGLGDRCRARMALGGYDAGANLGEASLRQLNSSAGHYDKNGGWVSAEGKWYVKGAGKYGGIYDTLEDATQALRDFAADSSSKPSERKTEFSVYMMRKDGTAYITIKGKPSIVVESGFKSGKEALDYLKEHYDDLVSKYDGLKEKTTVAFQENRPRKGKDWRAGKDVSAEEFREAFGFRGVEFGNWTNQADRQHALNNAYDALMDLADATGKSPRAMSLNGELGIAFGARGGGNASAHYEPEKIVINLTKTQGAGSLAHEWWHAIDNYFSRRRGDRLGYNTDRKGYSYSRERGGSFSEQERQELTQAFTDLMRAIDRSGYGDRSRAYASLKSGYWSRPTELGARAFAVWVERRLSEKGAINDFLANNPSSMGWDNENVNKYYPYPMESDFVALDTAFDNLFNTIQETTDAQTGNVAMYDMGNRDTLPMTEEQKTVYDAVTGLLEKAGIQVEVLGNEQMKALGHSGNVALWTKKKAPNTRLPEDESSFKGTAVSSAIDTNILNNLDNLARQYEENTNPQIKDRIQLMRGKKKSAPETDSVLREEHQRTVISSADGAKILRNLDKLADGYENSTKTKEKTFIGEVARALGIKPTGASSQYATFETMNGQIVTIRLSNHNATVSNFDNAGETGGISIVVSSKKSEGIQNDGNAHVVEYYYDAIKLRKAEGKPLAAIIQSIKQALYSGEYTDNTGLAVREEVNDPETIRMMTAGDSHTEDGIIYGATVGGKIYLNGAALNPETPIHEYTHIWDEACRLNNPELWDRGVELMKQTPMWDEVKNDPNYANLESDNDIASEVHSRLTGKDGAKRLENMAQKAKGKGVKVLLEKLRQWLKDFWWWLKNTMSPWTKAEAGRVSIDDFINMPLKDLLNGTDLHGRRSVEADPSFMGEKVTREELKAINAERRSIAEKAQKDGTWLKAPNGKASNLEPNQWVDVRTSRFKQWFGDWEKAARIEKLRHADTVKASGEEYKGKYELTNKSAAAYINDALRGEYTNKDTGLAVKITRKGAFKVTRHDAENEIHLKSIALIPQMIENAIFITEEKNTKRANSFDSYRYYVVGLNVGGVDYTAKLVAGVKKGETYYDHALTEIEKSDLISGIDEISSSFTKDKDAHLSDIKDKRLLSILQTNASKIVDENGEPMVVYHGTPKHWWHKFNIFNTKQVPGWFTSSQDYAGRYAYNGRIQVSGIHKLLKGGTIYEAFLNLQHPLYIGHLSGFYDTQEKLSSEIVKLTGFDANEVSNVISDIFEQGYEALPIWEITNSHLFKQLTQKYGYDGIIATETFNAYRSFAAFDSTQIKSATDNIGTYSPVNPDIRYHEATERALYDDDLHGRRSVEADPSFMGEKVTREELKAINAERRSIAEKAQKDGTWLKAPNGKASNLEPNQWVDVRTSRFKQWFGDWEKAARIEKLRRSESVEINYKGEYELNRKAAKEWLKGNKRGEYVNADTGDKIEISKVGINEVTSHGSHDEAHMKSLIGIPQMIERSIFIDEIPNTKDNDKYDNYRYYVCGLKIDDVDYTAKVVVGVKGDSKYYDHRLTEIEKGALITNLNGLSNSVVENQNSDGFISTGAEPYPSVTTFKDKRLLSILQTNASKIVDENGEPAMVQHWTPNEFTVFDMNRLGTNSGDNGVYGQGFYFGEPRERSIYGDKKISAFLDLKNPLYIPKHARGEQYRDTVIRMFDKKEMRELTVHDSVSGREYSMDEYIDAVNNIRDGFASGRFNGQIEETRRLYGSDAEAEIFSRELARRGMYETGIENLIFDIGRKDFTEALKRSGYDGVITDAQNREYVAFDSTQIKSATDNIGTYSHVNPDIRYHIAAERASYDDAIAEYRKQYDDLLEERDRLLQNRDNIPNFDQAVNDWRDKKAETVRALYNSIARLYGFADDTEIIVFNGERDTEAVKRIFLASNPQISENDVDLQLKNASIEEIAAWRRATLKNTGEGGQIIGTKIIFFNTASDNDINMTFDKCVEGLIHEKSHKTIEIVYGRGQKDQLDKRPYDRGNNGTDQEQYQLRPGRSLYGRRGDLTDVYESVKDIPAWQKKLSPYRNKPTAQQGGEVIAYSVGELTSPRKGYAFQRFMNGEISAAEAVAALKYHTPQLDAAVTEVLEALKEGLTVQRNANGAAQTTGDLKQAADNLNAFYADTTEEESKPRRSKEERLRERITELYNEVRKNKADTREIAHTIASEIRDKMSVPLVEAMGKRDFDSIVRVMENATVKRDLEESLKRLKEIVSEVEAKALQQQANMLVSLKVQGKSRHGVSVAKTVDDNTRMTFETLQKAIAEGKSVDALDAEINEEANRIYGETSSYNPLLPKWRASQLLRSYRDGLDVRADIDNIDKETRDLREQNRELWNKRVEANRQGNAAEARLFQNGINLNKEIIESLRDERLELQERLIGHLRTFTRSANEELEYGRSILQDWKEKKEIHKREIIASAFADCGDGSKIPVLEDKTPTWVDRKDKLFDFLLSPMYSMDFLLKMISVNAPNGEGTLYDHFVRSPYGYVEARGKAWLGYEECKRRLNDKARSIFGKSYVEALSESNRDSGFNITITDGKRQQSYAPTIGEALYIYMVDKMTDGRVKLRKMGIGEAAIMQLRDNLPSQYIALVDWIQAEFLPELRIKYNNTHLEAFGTQMAEVENYVPLKIQRGTIYQEVDGTKKDVAELPTAITGSIINRRRNTALIDLHTNALDLILQHCRDMENWNAFTFVVQDMNALLSNTEFRRLLNARNKNLHKKMKVCAQIAANAYISESNTPNKAWIALSKMAAASKIAFRVNTALKQILSYPAFYAYSPNTGFWAALTRNAAPDMWAANFKWALENIPSFRERWLGRMAGDEKLSQITVPTVDKWIKKVGTLGMYPNALVDAIVCANGAKAVYDHNIKRYAGVYDETEAGRRACIDAALAINETQQSSEGLFLSQLQSDRDFWSVSLSTFQNSNFAYLRKQMEGIYQLMRNYSNQYANRVEAYEKAGLSKEQAHKRAEADIKAANRTAIGNILVFMFMLNVLWEIGNNIWLYAFGNESEEEPDMAADLGKAAAVAVVRNTTIGPVVESLANGYDANPSVLLSDLIGFGERIRRATENDPKAWNNTAAYIAARILISNGTGVDLETFANMYHGIEGMIRDGADVEDIMDLLNAPQSQAKLIAGAPKEGESMQQYAERMAFVYRRINGRIDNKDMSRWEREYRNGKIDAIYAEHGGVKKNRQIENEYGEILRLEGISRSGDFSQTLKESFRYMSDIQKENKIQLAKAAAMIRHEEKKIEGLVVFNDSYAEQLMEIQRLKQEFIEEWRKQ